MNILEEIKGASTIGIGGHLRPDGDCIGASMGLYLYLIKACPEAKVEIFLEKPADVFSCISKIDQIHTDFATEVEQFDVFIALDTSKERLGEARGYFEHAKESILTITLATAAVGMWIISGQRQALPVSLSMK